MNLNQSAAALTTKLATALAVTLMSGVVATAYADNDKQRDRGGWSERGKHFEHGRRDNDRRDWRDHRSERRDHQRNWNDDRRGRWVNRDNERRYRDHDYYSRDQRNWDGRNWDGRDWGRRSWNYSDYRRYPYYRSHERYRMGSYYRPPGYRYYSWHHGDRLPRAYYAPRYVVYDYGRYGLHRPPYGHHWVRVDGDVVLAAIATGVVLQVVNQIFW